MTRAQWRAWQAETVDLLAMLIGVVWACALVARSRTTHYPKANPTPRVHDPNPQHRAELTAHERAQILALLNSPEDADLSLVRAERVNSTRAGIGTHIGPLAAAD